MFQSLSRVRLFATPWTVAQQAPLSLGFFRQEYYNGLPFPSSRIQSSSVQSLSCVQLLATSWTAACQASLSITNSRSLPKFMFISSSVVPFSSCLQSFPASGSFQMSQLFASGGQRIGVSASTSVLPVNTQD